MINIKHLKTALRCVCLYLLILYQFLINKYGEPSFWEVIDSFVLFDSFGLAASGTLLQQLLACLNFTSNLEDLVCWYI